MNSGSSGTVVALVPAAGSGVRLGVGKPKAFVSLGGSTLIERAVDGLFSSGDVSRVVVMVPRELVMTARSLLPAEVDIIVGGAERIDSVRLGLAASADARFILVHDAARPLTPPTLISNIVAQLRAGRRAVVPALPVVDTIKTVDMNGSVCSTPDRSTLRAIQTPQGFDAELLRDAYANIPLIATTSCSDKQATDDASLVELLGESVYTIPGSSEAFKITSAFDLVLAQALLQGRH
ncbi:MAG: 2-C-methyl-D-erythritol 4-phosphate cytidylyltransferase [Mycobacteriaceae bacterium]